jgi:hypothetical protein
MVAERYAALTGREIGDLPAMRVLAMLKLGIVFLQLQWIDGVVADPRYQRFQRTRQGAPLPYAGYCKVHSIMTTHAGAADGIDFAIAAPLRALEQRIKEFVREEIVPYEQDPRWTAHGPTDDLRRELNRRAKRAGVFAPHVSKDFGGLGLSHVGRAVAFTAAGYSILGSIALHCAAPDEGFRYAQIRLAPARLTHCMR